MEEEKKQEKLKKCEMEEKKLRFCSFSTEDAWKLGNIMVKIAQEKALPVALDIRLNHFQIFHVCMPGASPYNNDWIDRKHRMVETKQISSLHAGYLLEEKGQQIEKDWLLSEKEYAIKGGGFPILLESGVCIGSVACSGLFHVDDHQLVTNSIRAYLEECRKKG